MGAGFSRWYAKVDADKIFAYSSAKRVRVFDRRLGFIKYGMMFLILIYVVVFVFLIKKAYLATEQSVGVVSTLMRGDAYSINNGKAIYWDEPDIRNPALESGGIFVTTHSVQTKLQQVAECVSLDPQKSCRSDNQCPKNLPIYAGKCIIVQRGVWKMQGCSQVTWCPPEGTPGVTTEEALLGAEDIQLSFRGAIVFPLLGGPNIVFSNADVPLRYTLSSVLSAAGVSNPTSILRNGAILLLKISFACYVDALNPDKNCNMTPSVFRLDSDDVGFSYRLPVYYTVDLPNQKNVNFRDIYVRSGVRIFAIADGSAVGPNFIVMMLQIGAGLAMITLADATADFFMLNILQHKESYRKDKIEITPDFGDLRDRMLNVEEENAPLVKTKKVKSRFRKATL